MKQIKNCENIPELFVCRILGTDTRKDTSPGLQSWKCLSA